jgi:hypothetical protein
LALQKEEIMTPTETKPSQSKERYHIEKRWTESYYDALLLASSQDLERWANDPDCIEKEFAAQQLEYRRKENEERIAEQAAAQTVVSNVQNVQTEKRCYFCQEVIRKEAKGCPHCGKSQSFVIRFWKNIVRGILWIGIVLIALFALILVYAALKQS